MAKLFANQSFQLVFVGVLLLVFLGSAFLAWPKEVGLSNAQELCHAYGGAVLRPPYPQLAGVTFISIDDNDNEVCANIKGADLDLAIGAALNAK